MLTDEVKATIVAALLDMKEEYYSSGYSEADMDEIDAALAALEEQAAALATLRRQLADADADNQRMREDWLALVRMLAEIDDVDEWQSADDATLLEEFDPWQALRERKRG